MCIDIGICLMSEFSYFSVPIKRMKQNWHPQMCLATLLLNKRRVFAWYQMNYSVG